MYAEKSLKPKQENKSHMQDLKEATAIIRTLLANIEQQDHILRKSCMSFFNTFSFFLSYHEHECAGSLNDHSKKEGVQKFHYHPKHDIPFYILTNKFIALRSYDVSNEKLFEDLLNSRENFSDDCNLTKETADQLLNSMDSAWNKNKKVVKYASTSTRNQTEL